MNRNDYKITVLINSSLPDYRLFIDFMWGEGHNIDSDGDSDNPASRNWTYLYMKSREIENEVFSIDQTVKNSLVYEVTSSNEVIAKRAAYFLAKETNGKIDYNDKMFQIDLFEHELGNDFDLTKALQRAAISVWRKSSLENPYPNLQEKK